MRQCATLILLSLFFASTLSQTYNWTLKIANGTYSNPVPREYHTLTYISGTGAALLFGGIAVDSNGASYHLNDTYLLRLPIMYWQSVQAPISPPTRGYHTAVEANGQVIIYGGITAQSFIYGDVWRFDFSTRLWSQDTFSSGNIGRRTFHSAAYANGMMYVFGGFSTYPGSLVNDVWQYNVSSRVWTQLSPFTNSPSAPLSRQGATITVAQTILGPTLVLFGGYNGQGGYNDLWQYYVNQRKWVSLDYNGNQDGPSQRLAHSAISRSPNQIVIFGGFYAGTDSLPYFNDVWSLMIEGSVYKWQELNNTKYPIPYARGGHTMIQAGNNTYLFAGYTEGHGLVNDVWQLGFNNF